MQCCLEARESKFAYQVLGDDHIEFGAEVQKRPPNMVLFSSWCSGLRKRAVKIASSVELMGWFAD